MDLPRNNSDPAPNEEISSKETRKLRRSCEACRSQKAKCLVSSEGGERCLKCTKDGRQCLFLVAKARPKRVKNSKMRVAEMEEKLDGLLALLNAKNEKDKADKVQDSQEVTPPEEEINFMLPDFSPSSEIIPSAPGSYIPPSHHIVPRMPMLFLPTLETDLLDDVISKGIIGYGLAEEYVRQYRIHEPKFPFVLIPPGISLDTLRRERPFLLLSVLIHSSQPDNKLMNTLVLEFREMLFRRVMMQAEKSLDILQGLLVHLAWHHICFDPKRDQMYQLSQLAAAMATTLSIHKAVPKCPGPDFNILSSSALKGVIPEPSKDTDGLEARRALLGCYYVTSSISQALRMPYTMKYNDYMGECCSLLSQTPQAKSDFYLQFYIRFQQFADDVNTAFDHDGFYNHPTLDLPKISFLLGKFNEQLKVFQQVFPSEVWDNVQIKFSYHSIRIHLNEIGFHAQKPSTSFPTLHQPIIEDWYHSPIRTTALLQVLQAIKDLLHLFFNLSSSEILNFTFPECERLLYTVLVLMAFAGREDDPSNLDHSQVKQMANVEFYLTSLITKMGIVLQEMDGSVRAPMWIVYLKSIFEIMRMNYAKNLLPTASGPASRTMPGSENWWSNDFLFSSACAAAEGKSVSGSCVDGGIMNIGSLGSWDDMPGGSGWSGDIDPASLSFNTPV